ARTGQFSEIWFNTSISRGTGYVVRSLIRPDVFARVRSGISGYLFHPVEVFSPGQTAATRQQEMPPVPWIAPVTGRPVTKRLRLRISPYFRLVRPSQLRRGREDEAILRNLCRQVRLRAFALGAAGIRAGRSDNMARSNWRLDQNKHGT